MSNEKYIRASILTVSLLLLQSERHRICGWGENTLPSSLHNTALHREGYNINRIFIERAVRWLVVIRYRLQADKLKTVTNGVRPKGETGVRQSANRAFS